MTALPTAVVLQLGESCAGNVPPVQLVLEDETWKAIENLQSLVIEGLQEHFFNNNELEALFLSNPHLITTAKNLRDQGKSPLSREHTLEDNEQVQTALTFINELVRISIYLSSSQSSLSLSLDAFLKNIPSIFVNYQPVSSTDKKYKQRCQMLLIDTPGPNEAAGSPQLGRFVTNELRKADVILAVTEYGHLNTESEAKIVDNIKKIRQYKQNRECIYVLISKGDRRERRDMSEDELRQHVAAAYDVPKEYVFELSGKYALIARKFLADH
ncbi:unnamed protein product [Rotaria sp. Silwood1]|nr:unnamed protein product [Rotaria sp. Silwood1]